MFLSYTIYWANSPIGGEHPIDRRDPNRASTSSLLLNNQKHSSKPCISCSLPALDFWLVYAHAVPKLLGASLPRGVEEKRDAGAAVRQASRVLDCRCSPDK